MTAGRRLQHYELIEEIGRGGMGEVWRAKDTRLGRDVAVKLLHDDYLGNPDVLQRFVEEAQIGGQLQHPGIVPVYDLGLQKDRPFFSMKHRSTMTWRPCGRPTTATPHRSRFPTS